MTNPSGNGRKVGVVLSGCGFMDGSEIHESVLTLLALSRAGAEAICAAPDTLQERVIDHARSAPAKDSRNVLTEAARIARGNIRALSDLRAGEIDAVLFPGGYGAATTLSNFAAAGANARALPEVTELIRTAHSQKKPLGFICIAPALAAIAFAKTSVRPRLTIGTDAATSAILEKLGAHPVSRGVEEIEVDLANKLVSTPAYMLDEPIARVAVGIDRLVEKVLSLC